MNVRGRGTLVAWDHHTMAQRDGIVQSKYLNLFSESGHSTLKNNTLKTIPLKQYFQLLWKRDFSLVDVELIQFDFDHH